MDYLRLKSFFQTRTNNEITSFNKTKYICEMITVGRRERCNRSPGILSEVRQMYEKKNPESARPFIDP